MAIITISRQNGSLGDEIANGLAIRLETQVISRQYALDNFYGNLKDGTVARLNESAKFFTNPIGKSDRTYADVLVERIRQLASDSADSNLIVLGMGGCIILDNFPGAVHIRVTASDKVREKSVSRRYHISDVQAREALVMGDRKHKRFVQTLFGKDIADSSIYDMIINTDRLSVDECVDSIAELARKHDIRARLAAGNDFAGTVDHQTKTVSFKNDTEEEFAQILNLYNIEWLYEPTTFPVEWDDEGNVTMAISPDFYLPHFQLYLELTTMEQKYVTKKNKKMKRVRELYPGTNIRIVYKRDFQELVERLRLFGG